MPQPADCSPPPRQWLAKNLGGAPTGSALNRNPYARVTHRGFQRCKNRRVPGCCPVPSPVSSGAACRPVPSRLVCCPGVVSLRGRCLILWTFSRCRRRGRHDPCGRAERTPRLVTHLGRRAARSWWSPSSGPDRVMVSTRAPTWADRWRSRPYELYRRRYSTSKVAIDWLTQFSPPHLEAISLAYAINGHLW